MQSFIRDARVTRAAPSYEVSDGLCALQQMGRDAKMMGAGYAYWTKNKRLKTDPGAPKFGMHLDLPPGLWLAWLDEYVDSLCEPDPVYQAVNDRVMPVWWGADIRANDPLSREFGFSADQLDAFQLCFERTGIRSGIAIPVRGSRSGGGYIGFLSDLNVNDFLSDRTAFESTLLPVALRYFETLADTLDPKSDAPQLSNRERECLCLVAHGQTMPAIAHHLKIANSTVRYHIENAVQKLDVSSRSEAIAKALTHGLIEYSNS
jgi:DNA-binding CsgD family transcriptional regulator